MRARWEIFRGNDQWFWRLRGSNGRIEAESRGYHDSEDALSAVYAIEQICNEKTAQIVTLPE